VYIKFPPERLDLKLWFNVIMDITKCQGTGKANNHYFEEA